ncbi:hypothetical protein M837_01240 [Streptococcus equi subsp. zooepidemicus SzS31A1]|uniref:Uncharacterized protein n=2 Tax=Streptococcus equi subsp. zooepidemicus TaxID=40041 RepID=A0ABP2X9L4_STRSZ|nr:hypothetical protein M837_01240 [Streptococcus equi subsp. zooepidemicus SzS31A1]KIS05595.1 hypothetical protein AT54_01308 [Streptococcus equi subsp. zooepidemicus Sz12is]KIS17082.1 hypothetical protein AT55_00835 [Streptococcus equi subsp. zooepidemicus Sz4is]QTR96200.1 hypothetical protein HCFMJIKG_01441 [Streptococcus equi subsp. zooepidemicus]QTZ29890.1 hypothetical protein GDAKBCAL_01375 [Streptococcus equi subsp. zooepidemicus]
MAISDSSYKKLAEQVYYVEPRKAKSNNVVRYGTDRQETS